MIDLNTLSIPPVSVVPPPTADDVKWLQPDLWCYPNGDEQNDSNKLRRLVASLARRCRELEAAQLGATPDSVSSAKFMTMATRIALLERSLAAMKAGFLEIQDEYAKLEAATPVHLSTKLSLANHRIAELEAEVAATKIQLAAADEGLLKCSDPSKSWQGVTAECKGWENRAKTAEAEVERLRNKKCVHDLAKEWSQERTSDY